MKRLLIPVLCFTLLATPAFAAYKGLVQCDGVVLPGETDKKRCDFIELMNQIQFLINWSIGILITISVAIAAYAGIMYMYAGFTGDVSKAKTARGRFWNIFIGIMIVLFAWLIVRTILNWLVKDNVGMDLLGK